MNTNLIKKRKRNFLLVILVAAIVIGMVPSIAENVYAGVIDGSHLYYGELEGSCSPGENNLSTTTATESTPVKVFIDGDKDKSELPSNTVVVKDKNDAKKYMDMKVHSLDKTTALNQKYLASYYAKQMGKEASVVTSYGVYLRSAIPTNEVGAKKLLTWNNLSYKTPGAIYAVCYNQKDGAYLLSGTVDKNGTATFDGYILRDATSITVFAVK